MTVQASLRMSLITVQWTVMCITLQQMLLEHHAFFYQAMASRARPSFQRVEWWTLNANNQGTRGSNVVDFLHLWRSWKAPPTTCIGSRCLLLLILMESDTCNYSVTPLMWPPSGRGNVVVRTFYFFTSYLVTDSRISKFSFVLSSNMATMQTTYYCKSLWERYAWIK